MRRNIIIAVAVIVLVAVGFYGVFSSRVDPPDRQAEQVAPAVPQVAVPQVAAPQVAAPLQPPPTVTETAPPAVSPPTTPPPAAAVAPPSVAPPSGAPPSGAPTTGALVLGLPLRCEPGVDCWIANYVDMAAGPEVRDYNCGLLAYDGHKGTDFALRSLAEMRAGVEVIAAASGTVEGVRNIAEDVDVQRAGRQSVSGAECGNGVVLAHANGWKTQYCHMLKGSVTVQTGQSVATGEVLGKVGLSGLTEFPHVHLQVSLNGAIVDPFAGTDRKALCGLGPNPLWNKALLAKLSYKPTMIYNIGFAPELPEWEAVRGGRYREKVLPASTEALVVWAEIFGVQAGDKMTLTIKGPDGKVLINERVEQTRPQARRFLMAGKRVSVGAWLPGTYHGSIVVSRTRDKQGPVTFTAETVVDIK